MSNKIFPEFQGWSIEKTKTPIWKSNVYESESGRETRTQKWSFPRYRIELNYNFITDNSIQSVTLAKGELEKLQGFFNSVGGNFEDFLYRDDVENHCENQTFAVGDGVSIQFQLVRSLPDWIEPVRGIVEAPHIFINGEETTAFRYSNTGLIIFDEAPPAGSLLSWSGSYYFRVRFENEELELEREWDGLWSGEISLLTVK